MNASGVSGFLLNASVPNASSHLLPPEGGGGFPFPSGFSLAHIVCACVVISAIIVVILVGNLLVIVAVFVDHGLNTPQNWFIASLAVSDLLLGALVMPLSLGNEVLGYWPFGDVLCSLWLVTDVLLCTASILNLCLISIDRYKCITDVVYARRHRTPLRARAMIAVVWLLSMAICLPPLVGWKRPQAVRAGYPTCELSREVGYIIYSTVGSFYLPLIVMVVVYFKIYLAARSLARRALKKRAQQSHLVVRSGNSGKTATAVAAGGVTTGGGANGRKCEQQLYTSSEEESGESHVDVPAAARDGVAMTTLVTSLVPPAANNKHARTTNADAASALAAAAAARGDRASGKRTSLLDSADDGNATSSSSSKPGAKTPSTRRRKTDERSPARLQRKIARARERRATVVLGIIMATFIICWLPFFSTYLVSSLVGLAVHPMIFAVFFWFGYCNSALNPLIYTIFNREFRLAFLRIILRRKNRYVV